MSRVPSIDKAVTFYNKVVNITHEVGDLCEDFKKS